MTGVWVRQNTPVGAGSAIFPNAYAMLFSVLAILLSFLEYGIITTILGSIAFILGGSSNVSAKRSSHIS